MAPLFARVLVLAPALAGLGTLALLALLQGLTEFLPVSSSGHLVLAQAALGLREPALAIDVALHGGTLLAVLAVYRADLRSIARDALQGRPRELLLLAVGSLPAAGVGIGLRSFVEEAFASPRLAAAGLLATALILGVGEAGRRRRARAGTAAAAVPGYAAALAIGTAQAVAILPGVSRSGSTIAAGLLLGLAPPAAARFYFLRSIPAVARAA
ncbi:MAG: undecaprenyl-diphosphate phosphatase, partial [Planctomycetota bacterium]